MIPLRVLHVCTGSGPVGTEGAAVVGRWMAAAGHGVMAISAGGDWGTTEVVPTLGGILGWFGKTSRLARDRIQAFAPDLIQVHGANAISVGLRLHRRLQVPLVAWIHEEPTRGQAPLVRDRRIHWVVTASEHLRALAAGDLRIPRDRIALLPAACDVPAPGTRSVDGRLAVGIDADRHDERFLEDLVTGLADLRRSGISLRLVVSAGIRAQRVIKRSAGDLPVRRIDPGAGGMAELVQASDVLVHVPASEGHLLVVRLAMAMGRVVVVAGCGGPGELVRERIDGRVVAPGNVESIIDAIRDLADAPVRRRQGQAAAEFARNWSAPVVGEALVALYRTALGGGNAAQATTGSWCRRATTRRHEPLPAGADATTVQAERQ